MNGRNKAMCYTKDIHSYRKFSRNQSKEGISMSSIETFLQMVKESDNIVFFGGAGVSTESGIPDFRSVDGLYNQKYDYPPETILSHSFYVNHTEEFYRFYRDKMLCLTAKPNTTHYKLAELEKAGKLKDVTAAHVESIINLAKLEVSKSVNLPYNIKAIKKYKGILLSDLSDIKIEKIKEIPIIVNNELINENPYNGKFKIDFENNGFSVDDIQELLYTNGLIVIK